MDVRKYVVEFIGTFFLVLTIGCVVIGGADSVGSLAPLAIGSALMVMIFAGGHISGAHFNPAVTLGVFIRGKCAASDVVPYIIAQVAGAAVAALAVGFLVGNGGYGADVVMPTAPEGFAGGKVTAALLAEFLYTFALVWVVLNAATAHGSLARPAPQPLCRQPRGQENHGGCSDNHPHCQEGGSAPYQSPP